MSAQAFHLATLPRVSPTEADDTEKDKLLIHRLREFRLASLQADPDAFGSSYAEECQQPLEFWRSRLSSPKATHFVAFMPGSEQTWIGMVVLLGPADLDPTNVVATGNSPWPLFASSQEETHKWDVATYNLSGTFIMPSARGMGVARALLREALGRAAAESQVSGKRQVRCTLTVDAVNEAATKLYESVGFFRVAEVWYTPLPKESGSQFDRLAFRYEMRATLE